MSKDVVIRIDGWELVQVRGDAEPRIDHRVIAKRLGYSDPSGFKRLVERYRESGDLGQVLSVTVTGTGGRPAEVHYLTERQSLFCIGKSETTTANDIYRQVIDVYLAARRGQLTGAGSAEIAALRAQVGQVLEAMRVLTANPSRTGDTARIGDSKDLTARVRSALKTMAAAKGWSFSKAEAVVRSALGVVSYKRVPFVLLDVMMVLIEYAGGNLFTGGLFGPVRLATAEEKRQIELFAVAPPKKGGPQ